MAKRTSKKSAKVAKKAAAKRRFTSDRTKHRRVAKVSIGADELENVKIAQRHAAAFWCNSRHWKNALIQRIVERTLHTQVRAYRQAITEDV
jgi:hypothetical protein